MCLHLNLYFEMEDTSTKFNSIKTNKHYSFTSQSQGAIHQNQHHFGANLATLLYLVVQIPGNDQYLVQHEIYHLHFNTDKEGVSRKLL